MKNLNRIRRVLSAKLGTEIPKFTPGGPISITDPDFLQWCANSGIRPSPDNLTIYQLIKTKYPNKNLNTYVELYLVLKNTDSLDEIPSFGDGATNVELYGNNLMAIPGAEETSPYVAVEHAADLNKSIEAKVEERKANAVASSAIQAPPILGVTVPEPVSLNTDISQFLQKVQTKMEQEAESYHMNLLKQAAKKEMWSNVGTQAGQAVGAARDMADKALDAKLSASNSNTTNMADSLYDTTAAAVEKMGPWSKVAGTAMKYASVVGDIAQELGGGTDLQTKTDQWMDSSFFSWNIGMLNGFLGKNTLEFGIDQSIASRVGSSYGGSMSDFNELDEKAGKKYGLFSSKERKKVDAKIATAKAQQNQMGNIADMAEAQRLNAQSMGEQAGLAYSIMTDGGYNQKYTYAAKQGGLLEWNPTLELEWEPQIEINWELPAFKEGGNIDIVEELEWVPEFKDGGKTEDSDIPEIEETSQKNVIPEGALHKNKHHMLHAEGLTKKGIPVIDDNGEQQAEIEHSEIIFTLEVTKKLEEYYKIFYSEESSNKEKELAALDAGKLLVYQILENTEDRTGLIESCKKGGTLTIKESEIVEDLLDWVPTIMIVEEIKEEIEEEKPKKKFEKSELEKDNLKELVKDVIREALIELLIK